MPRPSRFIAVVVSLVLFVIAASADTQQRRRAVAPPSPQSSDSLIDQALQKGEIDANTALMYRVFADFGDARLPDRFKGNVPPVSDSTSLAEGEANWDSLPSSMQDAIGPYLIPPFQKGSWADARTTAHASAVRPKFDFHLCGAVDTDDWDSTVSSSGRLRIWWQKIYPDDAPIASALASDGELALQQYASLLARQPIQDGGSSLPCRGGDDAIDVALADVAGSQTVPFFPATSNVSSYVLLQRGAADGPEATLAHELFHVMQFTYDTSEGATAVHYKWLMEATAQWAMDYHRRPGDSGKEQRAAQFWFNDPDKSLVTVDHTHEYGAYLFFLYLSRTFGDSIIKNIWDATESHDQVTAVDSTIPGGFKERWPEFAVDAWNQAPNDKFNQWDQLSGIPFAQTGVALQGQPDLYVNLSSNLPALSAKYVHVAFDGSVRSLAFLNGITYQLSAVPVTTGNTNWGPLWQWSDASDDAKRGAAVYAIIKKNGEWQTPEEWSNVKIKSFCREKPDQAIDDIALIITNSDTDANRMLKSADVDSQLIATNIGCGWTGTMSFTASGPRTLEAPNLTEEITVTRELDDSAQTTAEAQQAYRYKTTGTSNWSTSGTLQSCSIKGSGTISLMPNLDNYTYNFVPRESAVYRKAQFAILLSQTMKYTMDCPGVGAEPIDAGPLGITFPPPPHDLLTFLDIKPDATLSGEMSGEDGTWKWNIVPK